MATKATGKLICLICAWREKCLKKYKAEGGASFQCPDFVRDLTIKEEAEEEEEEKEEGE